MSAVLLASFVLLASVASHVSAISAADDVNVLLDRLDLHRQIQPRQHSMHGFGTAQSSPQRVCAPVEDIPVSGQNFTAEEQLLLSQLCWQPDRVPSSRAELPTLSRSWLSEQRGLPPGVDCHPVQWCQKHGGACTTVCQRGSVKVEAWLKNALATQNALSRKLPFCYASMLGTHNSGITIADGYGTLDPYFQKYFEWIKFASSVDRLQTNDQVLSLTDQLNLGVRLVELDTHWVQGDFIIAHCGGFHSFFNTLIKAVNLVAKLLGHRIRWDTETIGCEPSLSSIPTDEQRTLNSALEEVADWLNAPGNEREFVALFFDDQSDLGDWGLIPLLMSRVAAYFPLSTIYTPPMHASRGPGDWPSMDEMLANGQRLLLLSGVDYGAVMAPMIFDKSVPVCNFFEPNLTAYIGAPDCIADADPSHAAITRPSHGRTLAGQMFRMTTCEITYGPLNCDFVFRADNEPLLDEATLPDVANCGVNVPSPDMLTPQRSASAIWSWAPAHPFKPLAEHETKLRMAQGRSWRWAASAAVSRLRQLLAHAKGSNEPACSVISASDGRWRAVACADTRLTACRSADADPTQRQPAKTELWVLGVGERGACPWGYEHTLPATPKENLALRALLQNRTLDAAWLPLTGPDWKVP